MKAQVRQRSPEPAQPVPNRQRTSGKSARFPEPITPNIALLVLLCFVAGAIARTAFLLATRSILDADEAIVGLMAKHIAEGRAIPIFYYGQAYMGTLESILISLVFRFLGVSSAAVKVVPFVFSMWFVWLVFRLGSLFVTRRAALVGALFAALPPLALMEWSLRARGGFIELVAIGTLGLIWTVEILRAPKASWVRVFLLGLLLGLAWWTNNQAVFFLGAIGFVFLYEYPRRFGFSDAASAALSGIVGFFVGGAPFWYYNLALEPPFQTFAAVGGRATLSDAARYLQNVFAEALPILLGARRFWSDVDLFAFSTLAAYCAWGTIIVAAFLPRRRPWGRAVLVLLPVITIAIFSQSSFGWLTQAPRYLLPLYPALFVACALAAQSVMERWTFRATAGPGLIVAFALSLLSNYLGGMALPGQPFVYGGDRVPEDTAPLYQWLSQRGYTFIRTNYWIGYRVALETVEQVRFSVIGEPRTRRIPEYEAEAALYGDDLPLVLVPTEAAELGRYLLRDGYTFEEERVAGFVVLHGVRLADPLGERVDLSGASIDATSRDDWASRLIDGSEGTRWGSGAPHQPGMTVSIRFPRPEIIAGGELDPGLWPLDASSYVTLIGDRPDGTSCVLYEGGELRRWLHAGPALRFGFAPVELTGLHIVTRDSHPVLDWSIAEVALYRPAR